MRIVCFEPDYDASHREVLRAFAEGARAVGADVAVRPVTRYEPCDVAVIFGLVKRSFKKSWSKGEILTRHRGKGLIVCEAAPVRRGDYWAVGWGGQAGWADFCNAEARPERWVGFGVEVKPWSRREQGRDGAPVAVCGQLLRDTTVQDTNHAGWCRAVLAHYRQFGPVVFRPHPREDPEAYGVARADWDRRPLAETLAEAAAVVTWNSTIGVDAVLAGVPVVAIDRGSFAWPVAAHGVEAGIVRPPRESWLARMGFVQWTLSELRAGLAWRHLRRGLKG